MPYIKEEIRDKLDEAINTLIMHCEDLDSKAGVVNYIISRITSAVLKPEEGWNYAAMNNAIGVFEAAKLEFYRKMVAPYEEQAITKNGLIKEYRNRS